MKTAADVTQLLLAWGKGDQTAFDRLLPLVYGELRLIAERYLKRERANHTAAAPSSAPVNARNTSSRERPARCGCVRQR